VSADGPFQGARPQGGSARRDRRGGHSRRAAAIALVGAFALAGCGGETHTDLRAWMSEQGKGARGKLDPLPQVKPYDPFAYNAFDLPDPFKPRKIEPTKGTSKLAPDLARRKEPLEAYPLESLSMVGTLEKNKTVFALVRTPEKDVFQVRAGNYLGQNFGVVTGIGDSEVKLKELVQDGAGDWTERSSTLMLQQADTKK
jgi:type IV pilus assembly protein PilP